MRLQNDEYRKCHCFSFICVFPTLIPKVYVKNTTQNIQFEWSKMHTCMKRNGEWNILQLFYGARARVRKKLLAYLCVLWMEKIKENTNMLSVERNRKKTYDYALRLSNINRYSNFFNENVPFNFRWTALTL